MNEDRRPDPKPRKHPRLWQAYLWWREMNEMRKRHTLRISSIEKGKSNLDADYEQLILSVFPYADYVDNDGQKVLSVEDFAKREMILYGREVGEIWDWLVSIRGIGEPSAAKLLAQFDDVGNYDTLSKFRRFAGWGTYPYWVDGKGKPLAPKDGYKWKRESNGDKIKVWTVPDPKPGWRLVQMIDRCIADWHSPYNRILKSEIWLVATNFVRAQTPLYVDEYYKEKERQRQLYPEPVTINGKKMFTDGHLEKRAKRKMAKLFLSHFYDKWREFEGFLPREPWILREGTGHTSYIAPPTFEREPAAL